MDARTGPQPPRGLVELPAGTDVWELHAAGSWVLVPTNTQRRADGAAVMGAGMALAAAQRFPDVPARYGRALAAGRWRVPLADHRLLLAPTKTVWRQPARLDLVCQLMDDLAQWCAEHPQATVALPAPGCGRGGLPWARVRQEATTRLAAAAVQLLPPHPGR